MSELRDIYGLFDEELFKKAQLLNDALHKKRTEREESKEELVRLREEVKRLEFRMYQIVSHEHSPGRQGAKHLKFQKEGERKAEVQMRISADINAANMQARMERLESRDRLFAIAIDWLEKEFSLHKEYLNWMIAHESSAMTPKEVK